MTGRARRRLQAGVLLGGALLTAGPRRAEGVEVNAGVNVGGIVAGIRPRLAVSPHLGASWGTPSGWLLTIQDTPSILPAVNAHGPGVYNHLSVVAGFGWTDYNIALGPALSLYSMPACSPSLCSRVVGIAIGGYAQVDAYLAARFGLSATVNVDWIGGNSVVLPGNLLITAAAGPIVRWGAR